MDLIIFLVCVLSISHTIVFLHITHWFRKLVSGVSDGNFILYTMTGAFGKSNRFRNAYLGRLVRCHACMGFWIGSFLSLLYGGFIIDYVDVPIIVGIIGDGFFASIFNFFAWLILRKLGAEEL